MTAHLPLETISAYLDGELGQQARYHAEQHLRSCARCSAELAGFERLDTTLAAPVPLDCTDARAFLSAEHDRELTLDESLVARAHAANCDDCRASAGGWTDLDGALAALPIAHPSRRVDLAIQALTTPPSRGPIFGGRLPAPVAIRAAVVVALVVSVAVAAIQEPARPPVTQTPESAQVAPPPIAPLQVIVASAQQALLNPLTNTYYLAYPEKGTVNVVDATSLIDVASIDVGGRPSALALNEQANTVLVLDPSQKLLSEIDARTNTLIGRTPIQTAGTPTALQVDPTNGRILIAVAEPGGAQSATPSGAVVVLDGASKKLETTSSVAVAPRQVVTDGRRDRALLVSTDVVTVVDAATYKSIDQLPGGVAATFSAKSDSVAILSGTGSGARVTIVGDENASLTLLGNPVAIIALPHGGYAVLTDETLNGRITEIAADGAPGRSVSVALVGRELTYNAASGVYAVAGANGIALATIGGQVAVTTPPPAAASPKPAASDNAASARPTAPSAPSQVAVVPSAPRERQALVPDGATVAWPGVYRFDLVDRSAPVVVGAGRPGHLWFVDAANRLTSLDATTGQAYTISQLPRSAKIRWIEVGAAFVYAVDASAGRVYIVSLPSEKVASLGFTFIASAADVAVTPDDLLWFAVGDQLLRLDPRTGQVAAVDAGAGAIGALAGDSAGRVWFAVGNDKLGRYDPRSQSIVELSLPRKGSVTSMVVDATGTLIVGTAAGEIFAVQNDSLVSSGRAGKAILQLALDPAGTAWYLSDDGKQLQLGAARLRGASRTLPASVVGIWFDARSNAWLADQSSAGFFIAVPEAR